MMEFLIHGHKNILGTHRNTFEFTKDKELSKNGDCIIGVNADFEQKQIEPLLLYDNLKITIALGEYSQEITAKVNKGFKSGHEMVFRITDYCSERTLGISSSAAAKDIDRRIIEKLKNPKEIATVRIEGT